MYSFGILKLVSLSRVCVWLALDSAGLGTCICVIKYHFILRE
jgi:hypothetical protein